jgi:hypothetical protein
MCEGGCGVLAVCGVCGVRDRPVDSPALLVLRHDFFSLYRQLVIASDGQCNKTAEAVGSHVRQWMAPAASLHEASPNHRFLAGTCCRSVPLDNVH